MSIETQAVRLLRKKWTPDIQPFVEELYLVLTDQDLPTTGASEVSLNPPVTTPTGGVTPPETTPFKVDPLPPWTFPPLDLPQILFNPTVPASSDPAPQSQDNPNSNQNQQIKTSTSYMTVPGKITESDGSGGYTVQLYVNGLDGSASRSVQVKEINQDSSLEVDSFTMVSAIIVMKLTTTTVLNQFNAPTSTNTSIKIESEKYYCQVGGGGGSIAAQIVSGAGATYRATLFPKGPGGSPSKTVDFTQLQIDLAEIIPAGTWVMASKAGQDENGNSIYVGQVAVWL